MNFIRYLTINTPDYVGFEDNCIYFFSLFLNHIIQLRRMLATQNVGESDIPRKSFVSISINLLNKYVKHMLAVRLEVFSGHPSTPLRGTNHPTMNHSFDNVNLNPHVFIFHDYHPLLSTYSQKQEELEKKRETRIKVYKDFIRNGVSVTCLSNEDYDCFGADNLAINYGISFQNTDRRFELIKLSDFLNEAYSHILLKVDIKQSRKDIFLKRAKDLENLVSPVNCAICFSFPVESLFHAIAIGLIKEIKINTKFFEERKLQTNYIFNSLPRGCVNRCMKLITNGICDQHNKMSRLNEI